MANYCAASDVSILLGLDNYSSLTRPTLTQVNTIIADITNEIDFTLASVGITTQPVDTRLLGRLKIGCKMGVAGQVGMSAYGNSTSVDNSQADRYDAKYKEFLEDIRTNSANYGAVTDDSNLYISNQCTDGNISEDDQSDLFINQDYDY